jgi:hypothetical protein
MKVLATRAFVVVAVSVLLVVSASRLAACTGATVSSNLPEFRALTTLERKVSDPVYSEPRLSDVHKCS